MDAKVSVCHHTALTVAFGYRKWCHCQTVAPWQPCDASGVVAVVNLSSKPRTAKETTDARGAQAYATAAMRRTFWLKARGLRHGRNQIFIRVGIQSRHKVQSGPSGPVVWGAWTSQPLVLLVSPDGTVSTITDKDKAAGGATVAAPRQQGPPPPASPPPAAAAQVRTRSEPILVN